ATLANASEAPHWLAAHIPPGLPHTFALTRLTVQNRRALCTLLWSDHRAPDGGAVIWSDTDGRWLDHSSPLGLNRVISALQASSAPHHASANPAHDRVWTALGHAPDTLVMISAGGNKAQTYRSDYVNLQRRPHCTQSRPTQTTTAPHHALQTPTHDRVWTALVNAPDTLFMISAGGNKAQTYRSDYVNLQRRRCCTWCRPVSTTYQEVRASTGPAGAMRLHAACTSTH